MIACTNFQNFEEGENCASTISKEHSLGYDMNLFQYDMILFGSYLTLFGSGFKFQELSVILVASLINFGVTNQVSQVSFKLDGRCLCQKFFPRPEKQANTISNKT